MEIAERDRAAYALAKDYLLGFFALGVTAEVLDHYLSPTVASLRPTSLAGVYQRLLLSAQNRGMSSGVVGGAIGGLDALGPTLCGFDPPAIRRKYGDDSGRVLDDIVRELQPHGKVRRSARSIWPLFCRTVTSGAAFLSQFLSPSEFYAWVDIFDRDEIVRPALPLLLSLEIEGFGFPLACDFLKEMGYFNFGKPDVHLKAILKGLGMAGQRDGDYEVFKAIGRIARHQAVSPYNVDKLFWLVGSGYFYDHPHIGDGGKIRTDRSRFIELASAALGADG